MSKQDWIKNSIPYLFPELPKVDSVLDVACGLSLKSKFIDAAIRVGVDIYTPYFDHIESDVPYVVMKHDVRKMNDVFLPKSFDVVIAMDIIEHLNKKESLDLIRSCERIARKAVVLETPNGLIHQNIDITGLGGHKYQTHRSGWSPGELESLGYTVRVRDYMMDDTKRHTHKNIDQRIQLLDAIKLL